MRNAMGGRAPRVSACGTAGAHASVHARDGARGGVRGACPPRAPRWSARARCKAAAAVAQKNWVEGSRGITPQLGRGIGAGARDFAAPPARRPGCA